MLPANIYTFTIAANAVDRRQFKGRFFKILAATGPVTVKSDFGNLESLTVGQGLEETPFEYLVFTDTSGANNTIKVFVGDQSFVDGLKGAIDISTNKNPISGSFVNAAATVTTASAQLLAANAARQYLLIQNKDATGNIWVNFGAAATQANGVKIVAGGSLEMTAVQSSGAIFAIGDVASNANVVTVQG